MSNAITPAVKFLVNLVSELEARAVTAEPMSKEQLRLSRAAASYRNSAALKGRWLP